MALVHRSHAAGNRPERPRRQKDQSTSHALTAGEEFREGVLVIGMPARQRRAILDEIARRPKNPTLVHGARHVIVRAEDVEVPAPKRLEEKVYDLFGPPCTGRLVAAASCGEPREGPAGNE